MGGCGKWMFEFLMADEIVTSVRENWEKLDDGGGISRRRIEDMRPAFSACYE